MQMEAIVGSCHNFRWIIFLNMNNLFVYLFIALYTTEEHVAYLSFPLNIISYLFIYNERKHYGSLSYTFLERRERCKQEVVIRLA